MSEEYNPFESGEEESQSSKKKSNKKKAKTNRGDSWIVAAILALVLAFVVFVVLLVIQKRVVTKSETVACIAAIAEVPEGVILTQENMVDYFTLVERPAADVPEGRYLSSGYAAVGRSTVRKMYPNELLTLDCISDIVFDETIYADIEDPVLISIDVQKIGNAVAGTLRPGDRVDVRVAVEYEEPNLDYYGGIGNFDGMKLSDTPDASLVTDGENDQANLQAYLDKNAQQLDRINRINDANRFGLINTDAEAYEGGTWSHSHKYKAYEVLSNVYVYGVFTSGGEDAKMAADAGNVMTSTVLNLIIPSAFEDTVVLAISEGDIFISKVLTDRATSSYDVKGGEFSDEAMGSEITDLNVPSIGSNPVSDTEDNQEPVAEVGEPEEGQVEEPVVEQ